MLGVKVRGWIIFEFQNHFLTIEANATLFDHFQTRRFLITFKELLRLRVSSWVTARGDAEAGFGMGFRI